MIDILVLAGGKGTRFGSEDKSLVEVDGRPIISFVFESINKTPHSKVTILTNQHNTEKIERIAKKYLKTFIILSEPAESFRKTIMHCKNLLGNEFLVLAGNQPMESTHLIKLIKSYLKNKKWTVSLYPKNKNENTTVNLQKEKVIPGNKYILQHPFILTKEIIKFQEKENFTNKIEETILASNKPLSGIIAEMPPEFDDCEMLIQNIDFIRKKINVA